MPQCIMCDEKITGSGSKKCRHCKMVGELGSDDDEGSDGEHPPPRPRRDKSSSTRYPKSDVAGASNSVSTSYQSTNGISGKAAVRQQVRLRCRPSSPSIPFFVDLLSSLNCTSYSHLGTCSVHDRKHAPVSCMVSVT